MQTDHDWQPSQEQQFEALCRVVDANAAALAVVVTDQLRPGDRGTVVEQLRYLANLIESQPTRERAQAS